MTTTEVTNESCVSRLWNSIIGVGIGIILFLIAFPVLFWNEGRAVKTARGLAAGKSQVVSVSADKLDPANEGKLVHLSGMATTEGTLSDPQFSIQAPKALRLRRTVEMYQWKENEKREKRKKLGGGQETVTTYTYEQVWDDDLLDSRNYKESSNHQNPTALPYNSQSWEAEDVKVGAFKLGALTEQVDAWTKLAVNEARNGLKPNNGLLYSGANPNTPVIGDARIEFESVPPSDVSLVAVQKGDSFVEFDSGQGGGNVFRLMLGKKTAAEMFAQMEAENTTLTWILRVVGFFLMVIGISLIFRPLVVVADVVPIVGSLLESGLGFVAFALAVPLTLVTIAVGWIAYRPLLGITLLLVAGAIVFFAVKTARSRKAG